MEKILFVSGLFLILVLSGCASKKTEKAPVQENETESVVQLFDTPTINFENPKTVDYSFLDESSEGQVLSVKGLLRGSIESGFKLTTNPDSKSAVTFFLKEDPENKKAYEQLSGKKESVITVTGELIDASKKWSKVMTVHSISE